VFWEEVKHPGQFVLGDDVSERIAGGVDDDDPGLRGDALGE
jgi:hypothetical protein